MNLTQMDAEISEGAVGNLRPRATGETVSAFVGGSPKRATKRSQAFHANRSAGRVFQNTVP